MSFLGIYPKESVLTIEITELFTIAKLWNQIICAHLKSMDKEYVMCIYNGVLFSHKKERDYIFFKKTNGTGDHQVM
jgi:hypothetical protein